MKPETVTHAALAPILAHPGVTKVLALLNGDGEAARLVGGAVRNALLGLPVADIDIATTALPQAVLARAHSAGIHAVPTGIDHGTVTLIIEGIPYEVTTLREDIATDGRHAEVRFGRDFVADALRRDFTINALSVGPDGMIHDYAEGLTDLAAQRVRFIGDADQRIAEDYLRILRFYRFSAAYGEGALDMQGSAAVLRNRDGLAGLSRERVRQEMMKLLVAQHALPVIEAMAEAEVLAFALQTPFNLEALARMVALETANSLPPDPIRRLMALGMPDPGIIPALRAALRLTNREVARMEAIASANPALPPKELLYHLGAENYRDALLLHAARTGADVYEALTLPAQWQPPKFILSGRDVQALGIANGPIIGQLLRNAEAKWLAVGMPASEAEQRAILLWLARNEI